jgi:hypothetical protein
VHPRFVREENPRASAFRERGRTRVQPRLVTKEIRVNPRFVTKESALIRVPYQKGDLPPLIRPA